MNAHKWYGRARVKTHICTRCRIAVLPFGNDSVHFQSDNCENYKITHIKVIKKEEIMVFIYIAARMLDYTISATHDSAYNRTQIII